MHGGRLPRRARPGLGFIRLRRRQARRGASLCHRRGGEPAGRDCALLHLHRPRPAARRPLRLDAHFAAGNFLRDAAAGNEIVIKGDGRPLRSYLYAADLAIWLWTLLLKGRAGRAYNVGSEEAVSIGELARQITTCAAAPGVAILGKPGGGAAERYVPDTGRARSELGLAQYLDLPEAIRRTLAWMELAAA